MTDPRLATASALLLDTVEARRLRGSDATAWRHYGPYLSERQWGTVREDYSADVNAWNYFPFEHARSRAYRRGEDGLAGFADRSLSWCLSLALWNGKDPFLKERLFGLNNAQGNHGEDVKELYFYQDATPSHSYLKMLYKYPFAAFPYDDLIQQNALRTTHDPEYELLDTGVFADAAYADVVVEYAKASPDDILMRISVTNRSAVAQTLHVLPQLFARNTWSWDGAVVKPQLRLISGEINAGAVAAGDVIATHPGHAERRLSIDLPADWLFCENDTNLPRLYDVAAAGPFKDGINDHVVAGRAEAIRRDAGTKCASHQVWVIEAGATRVLRLRFRPEAITGAGFGDFDSLFAERIQDADDYFAALQHGVASADACLVQRQAIAGLIWSKQYYEFDVRSWLAGDPTEPAPPSSRLTGRHSDWQHLSNADIVSMPDKWEYPWYASWDLCFHAVTFAMFDPVFAKSQLQLLLQERYMHPNGQLPAYEWNFGDANPPLHAWAAWRVYESDRTLTGKGDIRFLERVFHKLLLNFGWWVNRKDADGRNVFQGGFLGLDNIGLFDRSSPLPTGGYLDQADGTAWMAKFALNMMRIALELALTNIVFEDVAVKFLEHFLYIADAMSKVGGSETDLWDDEDQFFYDLLRLPDHRNVPVRAQSLVGLMPLIAVQTIDLKGKDSLPRFAKAFDWFMVHRPDLAHLVTRVQVPGKEDRLLLGLLSGDRMKAVLTRVFDPAQFLSDHGIRSVSKYHALHPFVFREGAVELSLGYVPGESDSRLFGGNSNWRGPVWLPLNYLLIEALLEYESFYGDDFLIEYPTGSGEQHSTGRIARLLSERLTGLFTADDQGQRPVMAAYPGLATQVGAADLVLFHEYFHGDYGRGVGASHQTGWSALVALLLRPAHAARQEHDPQAKPAVDPA